MQTGNSRRFFQADERLLPLAESVIHKADDRFLLQSGVFQFEAHGDHGIDHRHPHGRVAVMLPIGIRRIHVREPCGVVLRFLRSVMHPGTQQRRPIQRCIFFDRFPCLFYVYSPCS